MVVNTYENVPFNIFAGQEPVGASPDVNFAIDVATDVVGIKSLFDFDQNHQVLIKFIFDVYVLIKLNSSTIQISGDW